MADVRRQECLGLYDIGPWQLRPSRRRNSPFQVAACGGVACAAMAIKTGRVTTAAVVVELRSIYAQGRRRRGNVDYEAAARRVIRVVLRHAVIRVYPLQRDPKKRYVAVVP